MPDTGTPDTGAEDGGSGALDCSTGGICIQLTWSTPSGDLDLHLSVNGADYCTDEACYWANCQDGLEPGFWVEWDGEPGRSAGDPVIYYEALIGEGPELLRISQPLEATYTLGVYFNPPTDLDPAAATVQVFSDGVLLGTSSRTISPDSFWEVGDIEVEADGVRFVEKPRLCAPGVWMCNDAVGDCPAAG